jgi:hypothetical protein
MVTGVLSMTLIEQIKLEIERMTEDYTDLHEGGGLAFFEGAQSLLPVIEKLFKDRNNSFHIAYEYYGGASSVIEKLDVELLSILRGET